MSSTPHLTLDQLVAHTTGQPVAAGTTGEHLATCPHCQAEAAAWAAVAGGVHHLVATTQPPVFDPAPTINQNQTRPRSRRGTIGLATAAAAAVVLIGATVAAITSGDGPAGDRGTSVPPAAMAAGLTDTDCADLKVAAGTLATNGQDVLTLRTLSGESIPLTTTDDTQITRLGAVPLAKGDLTDGMKVFVKGRGNGDGVSAETIMPVPSLPPLPDMSDLDLPPLPEMENLDMNRILAQQGIAAGTVTNVSTDGFTVTNAEGGAPVRVSTLPSTTIVKYQRISLGELVNDERTVAVGTPQADGTLHTTAIYQNTLPAGMMVWPPTLDGHGELSGDIFSGLGCDSTQIAQIAILAISQL